MEWISAINSCWNTLRRFKVEEIAAMFIFGATIATIWPLWQSYLSVYDITLINRQNETHDHALFNAWISDPHVKGSDFTDIPPFHCVHIQVNPSWRGIIGSYTKHLSVRRVDRKSSVVIPVLNSGDIKRSRTFFIERDGVRELSSSS